MSTDLRHASAQGFTFYDNRQCRKCACLWTPAWPRWAGAVALLLGLIVLLASTGLFVLMAIFTLQGNWHGMRQEDMFENLIKGAPLALVGVLMAWLGIGVLRGTLGRVTVHYPGVGLDDTLRNELSG